MAFGDLFGTPFNEATSVITSGVVPHVAINGVQYRLDRDSDYFKNGIQSVEALRQQADNSAEPGEGSISREELWRAGQSSWHKGAGQRFRDKPDSDPERFYASRGVNVWTRDEFSLLHDTALSSASANASQGLITAGAYLYWFSNSALKRSADGSSWTTITGLSGVINSITTNGTNVWIVTSTGTFKTDTGVTAASAWTVNAVTNGVYTLAAYVNGRLLLADLQFIYEIDATGTRTSLNPDEGNTGWVWTAITEGPSAIYAAGYSGNQSRIFSIRPPQDDPSADLGVPVPAAPKLPSGELVCSLYGYLDRICIGTTEGIRVAEKVENFSGYEQLTVGALISMPNPVLSLDGDGRYVYFGWTDFDSDFTGLGRLDLGQETLPSVYAYASDLMAADQGNVTATATLDNTRYFTVAGKGIYGESSTYVSSGWLDSGIIRYGLIDSKVAQRVELRHDSLDGSVSVSLSSDGGSFKSLGTNALANSVAPDIHFSAKQISGYNFNVKTELKTSVDATASPVVTHVELRAEVVPDRGEVFYLPLVLAEHDSELGEMDVSDAWESLRALSKSHHTATLQWRSKIFEIIVRDWQWQPSHETSDGRWYEGCFTLKVFAPAS